GDRGPGSAPPRIARAAVEDLVHRQGGAVARIDHGGDPQRVRVIRVDRAEPGVVLLVGEQLRPGVREVVHLPGARPRGEHGPQEAVVDRVALVAAGGGAEGVVGPGGHQRQYRAVGEAAQVGGPGVGDRRAAPGGAAGEHAGEVLGAGRGLFEAAAEPAHCGAVGAVEAAAGEVAVPDGRGEVPRVVLGDDQVNPVVGAETGAGGVTGVAVDVADLLAGQQAAAELPGPAVVVGDEVAGIVVDRAHEAVQHAVQRVDVLVGDAAAAAERPHLLGVVEQRGPVEGLLGAPDGGVGALADPPAG